MAAFRDLSAGQQLEDDAADYSDKKIYRSTEFQSQVGLNDPPFGSLRQQSAFSFRNGYFRLTPM